MGISDEELKEWEADLEIEFPREGIAAVDDWTICMLKRREKRIGRLISELRSTREELRDCNLVLKNCQGVNKAINEENKRLREALEEINEITSERCIEDAAQEALKGDKK